MFLISSLCLSAHGIYIRDDGNDADGGGGGRGGGGDKGIKEGTTQPSLHR